MCVCVRFDAVRGGSSCTQWRTVDAMTLEGPLMRTVAELRWDNDTKTVREGQLARVLPRHAVRGSRW